MDLNSEIYWICTVARAKEKTGRATPGEIYEYYANHISDEYAREYLRFIRDAMAKYAAEADQVLNDHGDAGSDR